MKKDLYKEIKSSFLSCEKDLETIIRKLFVENPVFARQLKSLLLINEPDCLDNINKYDNILNEYSISRLLDEGYIRISPTVKNFEHEELKSFIYISFDHFVPNETNPEFRDCYVSFDIICPTDYWELQDYKLRPFKIMGIIDGILHRSKLSGIGEFHFFTSGENILPGGIFAGFTLTYAAIHGSDDKISPEEDE